MWQLLSVSLSVRGAGGFSCWRRDILESPRVLSKLHLRLHKLRVRTKNQQPILNAAF